MNDENNSQADPTVDHMNCVIQYLESNSKASNIWSMISVELNLLNSSKQSAEFWKDAFHRVVRRLNTRKYLIDYITPKYKNIRLAPLTKTELKLMKVLSEDVKNIPKQKSVKKQSTLEHISTHCRICLVSSSSRMVYLFDNDESNAVGISNNDKISLVDKLNYCSCLSAAAHIDDGLPQYMCGSCLTLIESAYELKKLCMKTEEKYRDVFHYTPVVRKTVIESKPIEIEVKQSDDLNSTENYFGNYSDEFCQTSAAEET